MMRLTGAVACLVLVQAAAHGQAPAGGPYETYRAAVSAYIKNGDITSAVPPLERWSRTEFDASIKVVIANRDAAELRAAAVFHLEIGVALVGLNTGAAALHFKYGSDLLDRWTASRPVFSAGSGEDEKTFRANWYGVAGSGFAAVKDLIRARQLVSRAIDIQPRSARGITLRGTLKELEAALFDPDDAATLIRRERMKRQNGILLYQAQQDYEQALRYDNAYAPAVIRLGRVLHLSGHPKQARTMLERGQALANDPETRYIAALFMGALLQDDKDVAGARRSFEQAVALAPTSQPAVVALAHLELMEGRPDRASELTRALAAASAQGERWWASHHGALDVAGLRWLRTRIMQ